MFNSEDEFSRLKFMLKLEFRVVLIKKDVKRATIFSNNVSDLCSIKVDIIINTIPANSMEKFVHMR